MLDLPVGVVTSPYDSGPEGSRYSTTLGGVVMGLPGQSVGGLGIRMGVELYHTLCIQSVADEIIE